MRKKVIEGNKKVGEALSNRSHDNRRGARKKRKTLC